MQERKDTDSQVESAILNYLREEWERVALLTGWVVVAEVMSPDGVPSLAAFAAEGMPYWKINGMLEAGPMEMNYENEDEELD